jgi:putative sporulation protein YtaF
MTGMAIMLSMSFGGVLGGLFGHDMARWLGASLLVVTGALALRNGQSMACERSRTTAPETQQPSFKLSFLGVLVQIIREPRTADTDESRIIDAREAIALGAALSVDSAGVGLGAALAGFDALWMTLLAAIACPLSLALGSWLAMRALPTGTSIARSLPAWALIGIGLLRLL